mmetsp:Transcript_47917/g.95016  ORF Transcript_47917/g.95016 Transcript_47917/m.95016 type:complete len:371 (+) Transcript_47917:39-1151(+)
MNTLFTQTFGCRVPIMGAPMAGVSGGSLAAATCHGGALGFIAAGHLLNAEALRREVALFRLKAPLGALLSIGFITHSSMRDGVERVEQALEEHRPDVVQYAMPGLFGRIPGRLLSKQENGDENVRIARAVGAKVFVQVGSEADAVAALEAGVDGIIAQGREAGGHGLRTDLATSTLPLAARVAALVASSHQFHSGSRPMVLAAGGIVDGRGLAASLALGCDAAVFGTRLWASLEATGGDNSKNALARAGPDDVVRTTVFDQLQNTYSNTPWPYPFDSVGALQNKTTTRWHNKGGSPPNNELAVALDDDNKDTATEFSSATANDDPSECCVYSGEGVGDINRVDESAKCLIERAESEAFESIRRLTSFAQL